jgi:hypothetical protein
LSRWDGTCCQEKVEVGGYWEVSNIEILPTIKLSCRKSVITQTSSGIQVTNNNDLTNSTEFGNVQAKGVEMGFCIQVTIFMKEVRRILRWNVRAA